MLRCLPAHENSVFLTFDDGPDAVSTRAVLEVLGRHSAKATFFVIAERARAHPEVLADILSAGHAIGNHSLNHGYRRFFGGVSALRTWIAESEEVLRRLGVEPVGFRPPAGVVTPKLKFALRELRLPLVMWNERFYDAVIPWSEGRARASARKLRGGSLVLLHDRQKPRRLVKFCQTLDTYLACLKARGLKLECLTADLLRNGGFQ